MNKDHAVYLNDILEAIAKIEDFIAGMSLEEFMGDVKTQDAVIRNVEIIGEAVKRLPDDFKKQYADIPWQPAGDMRNFLIHDYPDVIPSVVWRTAVDDLPAFKKRIMEIMPSVTKDGKNSE
ncbi:MAG TPA: DUF86 domain-containing protein [Candidatus Paceibacterota bacterium]